jgi:hypothetical protein
MRRIVQPSRVIYVDRNRERSLLFFAGAAIALVLSGTAWERRTTDSSALPFLGAWLAASVGLLTAALLLLLRQRAFVIDHESDTLQLLERRLFARTSMPVLLKEVGVRLTRRIVDHAASRASATMKAGGQAWSGTKTTSRIWIESPGGEKVLFLDDVVGEEGLVLARRLAADLRCSLQVDDRG